MTGTAAHAFRAPHPARPAGITCRDATPADRGFLCALYAGSRAAEMAPVPWPDEAKQAFLAEQFALQDAHYRAHYVGADFLVILRDGEPIGRVYVYRGGANEIRLMDIAIVPAHRRQGIARALLHELLDEARTRGVAVTLHVEPDNPAQILYRALGFTLIEDRGVYHFLGWSPDDARNVS